VPEQKPGNAGSGDRGRGPLLQDSWPGYFLLYFGEFVGWQGLALFFCEPLEVFDQFGGLDDQRHGEVLRGVERVPVAFGGEFTQADFYLFE